MPEALQSRTLKTRARLVAAAEEVISETGYGALRVEEVVRRAGVAKGTFFAHFPDKDALMDRLIGARVDVILDDLAGQDAPGSLQNLISALTPLMRFMAHERYVFDVILRHSGAAQKDDIGPIAMTFGRFIEILTPWLCGSVFRTDASPEILAEGVQAFLINTIALHFCALHNDRPASAHLERYLSLWLMPQSPLDLNG
ncbi:TetR/AcrR family transcriptional regulator [Aliisedimentitalea scapharcae]|uniref:TetR/AcrR family transcriptional regulator n=1 Tax=Aliisedimentitalea scapharcae TaxID=1524259 RepID=A0ABZ2XUK4_9RHOB